MTATLVIRNDTVRATGRHWFNIAPIGTVVRFLPPKRTLPQNDRMWAMLTDISKQVTHNGNKYSPEDWKALFMHACGHEVRFMPGLSGEPFPAGFRSSKLSKEQMTELMDFISCYAAQNGVRFEQEEE